jgi:hypothetical protein
VNPDWLYALARYRVRLADRRVLIDPSWSWFSTATGPESQILLQLIDLVEDKSAGQVEIDSTIDRLHRARGLDMPDEEDAGWIVVYGLTAGAVHLEPYRLAYFLGRLLEPSDADFGLIGRFLVAVDDIDDGYLDAGVVEQEIVEDFAAASPALAAMARDRLDTNASKLWIMPALESR